MRRYLLAACTAAACCTLPDAAPYRIAAAAAPTCSGCRECRECRCEQRGDWLVAETENFSVWSKLSRHETAQLIRRCEELRGELAEAVPGWGAEVWRPKCAVVIHANLGEYNRVFGRGQEQSTGCTTVTRDNGRIVFRRVDLRSDAGDWQSNALPHELAHVALADRFPDREIPSWLNEGFAMLRESPELQRRRLQVLNAATTPPPLSKLFGVGADRRQFAAADVDMRYATSLSLVRLLRRRGSEAQLLEFADHVLRDGYDAALRHVYAITGGVAELEAVWRRELVAALPSVPELRRAGTQKP